MSDWILLSMNVNFCLVFLFNEFSNLQDVNVLLESLGEYNKPFSKFLPFFNR